MIPQVLPWCRDDAWSSSEHLGGGQGVQQPQFLLHSNIKVAQLRLGSTAHGSIVLTWGARGARHLP